MNGSFARRIAVAMAAVALVVTTLSAPASAAAASLPADQTAVQAGLTVIATPPDLAVTSLGPKVINGSVYYQFKVQNIGIGAAEGIVMTEQVVVRHWYDGTLKDAPITTVSTPVTLNAGQYFVTEVKCPHVNGITYCDNGNLTAKVTKGWKDSNEANNFAYSNVKTKDVLN